MAKNLDKNLDDLLMSIRGPSSKPTKPFSGQFSTKEEWSAAVNAYKAEHGTTKGFQKGKLQYVDADGETWSYAAGTRGGPGHPRRASSTDAYTSRRNNMEVDQTLGAEDLNDAKRQFNQAGRNAGVVKGQDMHHMRTLNQYEPLLAGLSDKERVEALEWFKTEGFPLGNLEGNLKKQFNTTKTGGSSIADTHQGTGSIHEWMRRNRLEPNTSQVEYKQLAKMFEGKSLNERLPMYVQYLDNIQGAVQEKLDVPTYYSRRNDLQNSVGRVKSGPRAGERLPVNRATLAEAIIRDTQGPKNSLRKGLRRGAKWIPLAGIPLALSDAGSAFAQGNYAEGAAHVAGAAVGEIPIVGDAAVELATGSSVADGTVTGVKRDRAARPSYYGQQGPDLSAPGASERAKLLRKNPSSERGYETLLRKGNDLRKSLMSLFGR